MCIDKGLGTRTIELLLCVDSIQHENEPGLAAAEATLGHRQFV